MISIEKKYLFWFVIDVSGSVYGESIASVNATLAECLNEAVYLDQSVSDLVYFRISTFSNRAEIINKGEAVLNIMIPPICIKRDEEGFYPTTLYAAMYNSIAKTMREDLSDSNEHLDVYIFLITDGKPTDTGEYLKALEAAQQCSVYTTSCRYVALVGETSQGVNEDTLCFVDYKANQIIKLSDLPNIFSELRISALSNDEMFE